MIYTFGWIYLVFVHAQLSTCLLIRMYFSGAGLFQEADSDDNGYLSLSELQALLERPEIKLDPP